jgi:hypothetical protein
MAKGQENTIKNFSMFPEMIILVFVLKKLSLTDTGCIESICSEDRTCIKMLNKTV